MLRQVFPKDTTTDDDVCEIAKARARGQTIANKWCRKVDLTGCLKITHVAVAALISCVGLQDLNLKNCEQLGDAGAKAIAELLKQTRLASLK